jgi:hypothetical protein
MFLTSVSSLELAFRESRCFGPPLLLHLVATMFKNGEPYGDVCDVPQNQARMCRASDPYPRDEWPGCR